MTCFGLETYAPYYFVGRGECYSDTTPTLFNPDNFNANQWVAAAKAGGFKGILAIAKHVDGFCLWQTKTTTYSVASSPWKGGKGDVIKELSDACHSAGLRLGIYCAPGDLHYCTAEEVNYPTYNQYFITQLRELYTNYGTIDEVYFDESYISNSINWDTVYQTILSLQPMAVSQQGDWWSDTGHIHIWWPGNESGINFDTCWNPYPPPNSNLVWPDSNLSWMWGWGEWHPYEADMSLQGDWFWYNHPSVAPLDTFKRVYLTSVGRGAAVVMNIPPNPSGVIDTEAFPILRSFKAWVDSIYSMNLAHGKTATASSVRGNDPVFGADKAIDTAYDSYWAPESTDASPSLEVDLGGMDTIRMFFLQEYIPLGQRVANHTIQTWDGSRWFTINPGNSTRWAACDGNTGHWWMVDLGASYNLAGSEVMWEHVGHVFKYKIETSLDSVNWSLSVDKTASTVAAQTQTDTFTANNVRYVRITITGLDTYCWASFYDFKAFDSNGTNVALNKTASADCEQSGHPAANGNDGGLFTGSTIGYKRIHQVSPPVVASKVRLTINRGRSFPLINNFGIVGTAGPSAIKWTSLSVTQQPRLEIQAIRRGHIHLRLLGAENISIELVRIDGKTIKRQPFFTKSGVVDFSIPQHASGVYILKASTMGKEAVSTTIFLQ
ncbi:MAG: alpha-L-fucosidase [Chitinispirillaceae bacterium]|jgi:alpha-L-fucosidase